MTIALFFVPILVLTLACLYLVYRVKTPNSKPSFDFLVLSLSVIAVACLIYHFLQLRTQEKYTKEKYTFLFLDDAANVQAHPEIYCGRDLLVPDEYDQMGTRFACLKKGIGIGMGMPNAQRDAIVARAAQFVGPRPKVYCGNNDVLPADYTSMGDPYLCLRKGVGAGMRLPEAQRIAFQQRAPRALGKKEIMTIAKRLGVTTHDKTRAQTLTSIRERL